MEKFTEKFKNFFSSDESLKRVPKYLFILCVLFVAILAMLVKINNNLVIIANNKSNVEIITEENKENDEIKVSEEKESQLDDYLPFYNETTSESISEEISHSTEEDAQENTTENLTPDTSSKITYVINTASNKIHFSDCSFANRMKDENKKVVKLSKSELNDYLNNGYTFCKTCGGN